MVIAVSGGYIGWHYRPAPNAAAAPVAAPQPAIPVTSATAERRDVPIYLTGLGAVRELLRAAASTGAPHHNLPGFTRVHWVPLANGAYLHRDRPVGDSPAANVRLCFGLIEENT